METDVQAATPSVATDEQSDLQIPRSGTHEYAEWRMNGTLPPKKETPKLEDAEAAAAGTSKETVSDPEEGEIAPETESGKPTHESRRKPGAEARIGELTAETKRLKAELEEARRPKETQAASSPAKSAEPARPQNYQDWRKGFKPTEWTNQYATEHPDAAWEDVQAAMADHMADMRDQFRTFETQVAAQRQTLGQKLEEARSRYENYDEIASPVIQDLLKPDIPREVMAVLNDSPVLADLLYTIGGTEASKTDFLEACRKNPSKALRVALLMEQEITAELAKGGTATGRDESGKFTAKPEKVVEAAPVKKGPESTPAPPLEIGSRGVGAVDDESRTLSAIERGDANAYRAWKRAEDAKEIRRRHGA